MNICDRTYLDNPRIELLLQDRDLVFELFDLFIGMLEPLVSEFDLDCQPRRCLPILRS